MSTYDPDQLIPADGRAEQAREPNGSSGRSRREFLATVGGTALATGLSMPLARNAHAPTKTLRILQWNHFVPAYDEWFNNSFIKQWVEQNDTEVMVTIIGMTNIEERARTEIGRKAGHDICMFLRPPRRLRTT